MNLSVPQKRPPRTCTAAVGMIGILVALVGCGRGSEPREVSTGAPPVDAFRPVQPESLPTDPVHVGVVRSGDRVPLVSITPDRRSVSVSLVDAERGRIDVLPPLPRATERRWITTADAMTTSDVTVASIETCSLEPIEGDGSDLCPMGGQIGAEVLIRRHERGARWTGHVMEGFDLYGAPELLEADAQRVVVRITTDDGDVGRTLDVATGELRPMEIQPAGPICAVSDRPAITFPTAEQPTSARVPSGGTVVEVAIPPELSRQLHAGLPPAVLCASAGRFLAVGGADPPMPGPPVPGPVGPIESSGPEPPDETDGDPDRSGARVFDLLEPGPPVDLPAGDVHSMHAVGDGWVITSFDSIHSYDPATGEVETQRWGTSESAVVTDSFVVLYEASEKGVLDHVRLNRFR